MFKRGIAIVALLLIINVSHLKVLAESCSETDVWRWECRYDEVSSVTRIPRCDKVHVTKASSNATGYHECKLTCGENSMLFPKPSGKTTLGKKTVAIHPTQIRLTGVHCHRSYCKYGTGPLMRRAFWNFKWTLMQFMKNEAKVSRRRLSRKCRRRQEICAVNVKIDLKSHENKLSLTTDESYSLKIDVSYHTVNIIISANTFFGARHALETVSQLTAYHDSMNALQIVSSASIYDKPQYPYRGVLLDTSRHYFSVASIKKLITAMSYNKLNTFHWHITDTHSFPIQIKSVPKLSRYGAYSPQRVYTPSDVRSIIRHAASHGVRVLPEFDQPAHVGEGWQWGEKAGLGKLAVCVNKEPWQKFCLEPPCGQLNPVNKNVYNVLSKIYKEFFDLFQPDLFHAGGDEVNFHCWNTTQEIADWVKHKYGGLEEKQFLDLWGLFLKTSSERIYQANNNKQLPLILWTSKMTRTENINTYLDPKKHIVQIWSSTTDANTVTIAESGFRTIFTNYNTMYLDCGVGNWVAPGNNWCSPYKDWKLLYDNDPVKILENLNVTVTKKIRENILGQEAPLWTEQTDETTSEGKIWPRAAALAERVWTNPDHNWREAEYRLLYHRYRMVSRGVRADALQPLWCVQNTGHCYWDSSVY